MNKTKFIDFFFILFLFNLNLVFPQVFQIEKVNYEISGITKQDYLKRKIEFDFQKQFNSEQELLEYLDDIKQKYQNLRLFDKIEFDITNNLNSDNIVLVEVTVMITESKNFVVVPYYKYDSDDGHTIKAKLQDSNFLGKLNEFSSEGFFSIKPEKKSVSLKAGAGFEYNLPFYLGILECSWNNAHEISYTFGKNEPEWDLNTGLSFRIPFDKLSLNLDLTQSFVNDFDYAIYHDELHFGQIADFTVPIVLQTISGLGDILYIPGVHFEYNWGFEKINEHDDELISPELLFSHLLSLGRINWHGNFRKGFSFYVKQEAGYNFYKQNMVIGISGELQYFYAWKYAGINARLYGFSYINKNLIIDSRLRGIRENTYFEISGLSDINYSSTPIAIILNLDFPIHLLNFDFSNSNSNLLKKLNFEVQVSPFIDFALLHNRYTQKTFDIQDSFICAGIEFTAFPERYKSLQIRASAGFDLSQYIFKDSNNIKWRPNISPYEISFGLGLHF